MSADQSEPKHRSFEDLIAELEAVAASMDRGEIGIEEAANLYERASALHREATARLAAVQERVSELRRRETDAGDA